jgi:ornithine cyclodeaminase/alanine dehydrogenase-like protein (mu-crystallin family)
MRVGGTSALGAKYMARTDATVMGLIGAGWQAGAQVLTTHEVRRLEKVKVFSPTRARRDAFAVEMRERLGIAVEPVGSPEEAARGVDILHSATNSRVPTITLEMVSPGVHVGVISVEEVDERVVHRAETLGTSRRKRLPYSHWAIANGSATDIHEAEFDHGWWKDEALMDDFVELGELIHGRARGRHADSDVSFFVSGGAAIQFAAVGAKVLEAARARGLGRDVPVEWFLQPYHP